MTFFQPTGISGWRTSNTRWSSPRRGAFGGRCSPLLVIAGGLGCWRPCSSCCGPLQPAVEKGLSCSLRFREEYGVEGGVSSLAEVLAN